MKGLGLMFILAGCSIIGAWMDFHKKKAIEELEGFVDAFELLRGELDYGLSPLEEACENISIKVDRFIGRIFIRFKEHLSSKRSTDCYKLWKEAVESEKEVLHLDEESLKLIHSFGAAVGTLDLEMQMKNIEILITRLKHVIEKKQKIYEKNEKLYTSLGVLGGVCVVILLI